MHRIEKRGEIEHMEQVPKIERRQKAESELCIEGDVDKSALCNDSAFNIS